MRLCPLKWISQLSRSTSHIADNVTFPKECEDLRKENKFLSNEIHMERIMMRTENELTMRNLRNLNQELQAQVKEVHSTLDLYASEKVCLSGALMEKGGVGLYKTSTHRQKKCIHFFFFLLKTQSTSVIQLDQWNTSYFIFQYLPLPMKVGVGLLSLNWKQLCKQC